MAVSVSKTFTAEVLFASELNTNFTDITGGGIAIISPWTGNCDADGFDLTDMGNIIYREESKSTTSSNQGALYCNAGAISSLTELFFGGESNRATIPLTLQGGRQTQTIVYLTNKSGGSLAAGDLVIQDTGNDSAVTTTTSVGSTATAFVCLETIANNSAGYFLAGPGIVTLTAADAVSRGNSLRTSSTVKRVTDASSFTTGDFGVALEAASGAGETFSAFFRGTDLGGADPVLLATAAASTPAAKTLYEDSIVKMWVSKTGFGTPSIADDVNVSSITDVGSGDFTPVFATNFSNGNYGVGSICRRTGSAGEIGTVAEHTAAVGSYRVNTRDTSNAVEDSNFRLVAVGNN